MENPKANNELWYYNKGFLCGYTEDKDTVYKINRYKIPKGWTLMATYSNGGRQYKIPIEQRRVAERIFDRKMQK